nr:immunoglobulin heavy chain junction region [Macaca mulatta]MOX02103.1 immunoglobulin heavy chain junction region [Macaca mulatta]MOX02603.1 immunoglobulin heavy chain junction region [Macaca mulatta]MOX03066.1 immunoglobulin heavy chain junction region [Macaca mulatta]MOX03943.1 immunoglobulin heavy chain junction region [Macaca mulatta]
CARAGWGATTDGFDFW